MSDQHENPLLSVCGVCLRELPQVQKDRQTLHQTTEHAVCLLPCPVLLCECSLFVHLCFAVIVLSAKDKKQAGAKGGLQLSQWKIRQESINSSTRINSVSRVLATASALLPHPVLSSPASRYVGFCVVQFIGMF